MLVSFGGGRRGGKEQEREGKRVGGSSRSIGVLGGGEESESIWGKSGRWGGVRLLLLL